MPQLMVLRDYYSERFTPYPWMLVPFLMSFLLAGFDGRFFMLSLYLMGSFPFYRLFDDLMMRKLDQDSIKKRAYLAEVTQLKKLIIFPLILYLALTTYLFGLYAFIFSVVLILVSLILYQLLDGSKASLFISILKYPLLGLISLGDMTAIWPWICAALFLFHELTCEKLIPVSTKFSYGAFAMAVGVRLFGGLL